MTQETSCCFTGHRPERLPWGTDETDERCLALKKHLEQALEQAYERGCRHFVCGMARGADLYFAEAVLAMRKRHPGVTLECARPCETQACRWSLPERQRYEEILECCDYETMVQHHYDRNCMMRRNRYMVDRTAHIIAVYDGVPSGGTAKTLAYAMQCGLDINIIPVNSGDKK